MLERKGDLNKSENIKYEIEKENNPVAVAMMLRNRINNIVNTYDSYASWLNKWGIRDRTHKEERDDLALLVSTFNSNIKEIESRDTKTSKQEMFKTEEISQLCINFLNEATNSLQSIFHKWVGSLDSDWGKRSQEVNNAVNADDKHHMARMVACTLVGLDTFGKSNQQLNQTVLPKSELEYATRFQAALSPKLVKDYELHGFKFSTAEKKQAEPELKREDSLRSRL